MNKQTKELLKSTILQVLTEAMAGFLDSDGFRLDQSVYGFSDPVEREKSELHIRMATAAFNELNKTMFAAPPPASEGVLTGEDYRNLIDTHIGRMGELEKASIKHFIETGTISGSFNLRLVSLINFAISLAKGKAALATLPTREPEERKFSQSEIEALQSSIYEITGAGEVMELFNKMLGVNAG